MNDFYQWPACNNCESIFPRAVLIRRICNLAKVELSIKNVYLPKPGPEFQAQLENRLVGVPYLEMKGEKLRNSRQIWEYLLSEEANTRLRHRITHRDSTHSFILQQWANESFINSLVFGRWKKENNFQKLIAGTDFGPHSTPESIAVLRKHVLKYLGRTPIGDLDPDAYQRLLVHQFSSLETIIEGNTFFETFAKYPTLTDLTIYMIVQGFLSSDMEESQWIQDTYPNVVRWFKNVDEMSSKNPPVSIYDQA